MANCFPVDQLRLGLPGGSRVVKPVKMKLFVTDGTDVGLSGTCLVFMRSKMDGPLTESNITQVKITVINKINTL